MNHRRYLLRLLLSTVLALAALAGVQLMVDPLGLWPTGLASLEPWRELDSRATKGERLAEGGWDALIFGSSRARTGFDPSHPVFDGMRTYNAALFGTSLLETEKAWQVARKASTPERVLLETSLLTFNNARASGDDYADSRLPTGSLPMETRLGWLFGWNTTKEALKVLRDSRGPLPDKRTGRDGHRRYRVTPESNLEEIEKLLTKSFLVSPSTYVGFTYGPDRLEAVRRIATDASSMGAQVDIVVPPVHAVQLEVVAQLGLEEDYEQMLSDLSKLSSDTVTVWDFSGFEGLVAEPITDDPDRPMRGFYESSHFTTWLGGLVLSRVYNTDCDPHCEGLGVRLTPERLPGHLAERQAAQLRWREANPGVVRWIDELYAQTEQERQRRLSRR